MTAVRQSWLVAAREMRERGRSRAFRASLALMVAVVVGVIALPSLLERDPEASDVGIAGEGPEQLPAILEAHGDELGLTIRVREYDEIAVGEAAVREGSVDVLLIDASRLEWRRRVDEQLQAVVVGAVQLATVQERASALGIAPEELGDLLAPVSVTNVELGTVAGRSPDDETAAMVMTVLLFIAITTYGNLVLTGVVEEKSSRVVEVLLARMPARNLLAGKVAGIGLLGLAQFCLTALAAFATTSLVDSVDVPAARGAVLAWVVVWFVLGYALYAMVYGALGSLASRVEDAQSAAGPVVVVLMAAYFASFATIGQPDGVVARVLSLFPVTAPLVMPNRVAMGAASWWELVLAVVLAVAAIGGLVLFAGRVYARAVLHSGPTLTLRQVVLAKERAARRGA